MRAFLLLFILVAVQARVCDKWNTEAEVLKSTDKDLIDEECLIALMDNGWYDAADLKLKHAI